MIRDPYISLKTYFEHHFLDIRPVSDSFIVSREAELINIVQYEDRRIALLSSLEVKDVLRAEGHNGLKLLGYPNEREFKMYNFIKAIPAPYDFLFVLYYVAAMEHILQARGQCQKCQFVITLPVMDRAGKQFFRSRVRLWVSDYQRPEQKPMLMIAVIDIYDEWSSLQAPIKSVGAFENAIFPDGMKATNDLIKRQVSEEFLRGENNLLGLNATSFLVMNYLRERMSTAQIAQKMNKTIHDVNSRVVVT